MCVCLFERFRSSGQCEAPICRQFCCVCCVVGLNALSGMCLHHTLLIVRLASLDCLADPEKLAPPKPSVTTKREGEGRGGGGAAGGGGGGSGDELETPRSLDTPRSLLDNDLTSRRLPGLSPRVLQVLPRRQRREAGPLAHVHRDDAAAASSPPPVPARQSTPRHTGPGSAFAAFDSSAASKGSTADGGRGGGNGAGGEGRGERGALAPRFKLNLSSVTEERDRRFEAEKEDAGLSPTGDKGGEGRERPSSMPLPSRAGPGSEARHDGASRNSARSILSARNNALVLKSGGDGDTRSLTIGKRSIMWSPGRATHS